MTAGIDGTDDFPPAPTGDALPWEDDAPGTWDQRAVANLEHFKYVYEPGTRRAYSNLSYSILGVALSRAAGRPYDDYVENEILRPLGMNDTGFAITEATSKRFAYGSDKVARLPSWRKHFMLP